jgi:hypothetical protein
MYKCLKIYGERNTNTNYLSRLVSLNLECQELRGTVPLYLNKILTFFPGDEWLRDAYFALTYKKNLGWKHRSIDINIPNKLDVFYLTITKNPYSWLLSLYRNPYHRQDVSEKTFEEFLTSEWITVGREGVPKTLATPIELWNLKNASYFNLPVEKTVMLTTERLIEDPELMIHDVSSRFGIDELNDHFVNYEKSTKETSKDSSYYKDYYLNEKWRENLSKEAISIINGKLDKSLMIFFGYTVLQ